eukprot:3776633-Prymnesium_polylepis.1
MAQFSKSQWRGKAAGVSRCIDCVGKAKIEQEQPRLSGDELGGAPGTVAREFADFAGRILTRLPSMSEDELFEEHLKMIDFFIARGMPIELADDMEEAMANAVELAVQRKLFRKQLEALAPMGAKFDDELRRSCRPKPAAPSSAVAALMGDVARSGAAGLRRVLAALPGLS